ncbi:MAG: GNAT family N-acetyltransferase [Candidatus Acidiferrales bacterium]
MHTYSHLLEHPLALDARVAIYGREATRDRHPHSAIHFYPTRYMSQWKMRNGEGILLRPIRPDDEPLMVKFHRTLSEQSVYLRYFHMENLSARVVHERLIRKCGADFRQEIALVAERIVPETGEHEILAAGRLSKMPPGQRAEIAVLVCDRYQQHGLGKELVRKLIEIARDEKLQEIVANILPENLGMRALADRFGFQMRPSKDPTMLTAVLNLAQADAALGAKSE